VLEDMSRKPEVPSEADSEQGKSDDGSDPPGSQNLTARSLLLGAAVC
jgi:hypothetical protein